MAYLGGNVALAVECELRGQEVGVGGEVKVSCSARQQRLQQADGSGNGYPQSQGYQSQKILFHLILA